MRHFATISTPLASSFHIDFGRFLMACGIILLLVAPTFGAVIPDQSTAGADDSLFRSLMEQLQARQLTPAADSRRLLSENPTDPAAYLATSLELYRNGDVAGAVELLEKGRRQATASAVLLVGLSTLYTESNRLADAEEAASAALDLKPDCVAAYVQLGEIFSRLGWHDSAISNFGSAIEIDSKCGEAWLRLGRCLESAGRVDDATGAYRSAAQLLERPNRAWNSLGALQLGTGNTTAAVETFTAILSTDGDNERAQSNLVLALALSGEGARAEARGRAFAKSGCDTPELWLALGEALEQQDKLREAFACYGKVIALAPDSASPHSRRARLFCRFQQYEQALAECSAALNLDSDDALAHACMGMACAQLDRHAEARDHALLAEAGGIEMDSVWAEIGR